MTAPTADDPVAFVASVEHPVRRSDAQTLLELMARATGEPAVMWGTSMVGFGSYHYRYESGREGDSLAVGFSPRKASMSIYGLLNDPAAEATLQRLGKHKVGKGCLYVSDLADVDLATLEELVTAGYRYATQTLNAS